MQKASKEYKESMRKVFRNRGYIKVFIGVVNSEAQNAVSVNDVRNRFAYFSDTDKPFQNYKDIKLYATGEQDFSHVDGSMYFLPHDSPSYYNNGIVTEELSGSIYVVFGGKTGLDIKGLTVNFGECFPVDFTVENDSGVHYFSGNAGPGWSTDEVFYKTSYLKITPSRMVNGGGRLRILGFICGIANTFTNKEVSGYTFRDYVSPISDTMPSQDMSITVDNRSLYYNADNPDSALAFMEIGQEVKTSFGYDVDGNGNIEWIAENTARLKSWSANDREAKFTATDLFDNMDGTYYGGIYRENGTSLYNLAIEVLHDAGITDSRKYYIDPYLKNITVSNPVPAVKHREALQIIANAGRCVLSVDRENRICIKSSFIPDMSAESDDQTPFSHVRNVLTDDKKDAYAIGSRDFTTTDESVLFLPRNRAYLNTGYISGSVAGADGAFVTAPKITIMLEAGYEAFGMLVLFRNVAPEAFHVVTYYNGVQVNNLEVQGPELEHMIYEEFRLFDKMEIIFTKGAPDSRVAVDNIILGNPTDYTLSYGDELCGTPAGTRQEKIKSISVERSIYRDSSGEIKELSQGEIIISPSEDRYTVQFGSPSYGFVASVADNPNITVLIESSSCWYAALKFTGISSETVVKYSVNGFEYAIEKNYLVRQHNAVGAEKVWSNPLISSVGHAGDLEEWLAVHYTGELEYSFKYRGDPRVDANDLFYLELKERDNCMIRGYENTLKFKGGWSGNMKARKVVL